MARLVGVLALQGAFREHMRALERCGARVREVRDARDLDGIEGLVLPGGESTVMGRLLREEGLMEPVRTLLLQGLPVLGTCAGMILLARDLPEHSDQPRLGVMDISVRRNAFGRQVDSFTATLDVAGAEGGPAPGACEAVFIRAPLVETAGQDVTVLARAEGRPVAVMRDSMLALSFHPELTPDTRFHEWLTARPLP